MTDDKRVFLRHVRTVAVVLAGMIGMAGCSSVPDAVNPVEWYHGIEGMFESDQDQQTRSQAKTAQETAPPLPGTSKDYPNLSTVPERPRSVSSSEERNRISQGLAADRENARYAEPEPDRPPAAALGAPTPAPRVPVTQQAAPPPAAPSPEGGAPSPAPGPRSSVQEPAPSVTPPAAPQAAVQPAAAPPAQPAAAAPSTVEQTYRAALAQQAALDKTALPVAMDGSKTLAGTPIPRSFMVYFGGGSTRLDAADRSTLREVIQLYKSTGGNLRIVGHASSHTRRADALSQRIANFRISSQRAEAVARELTRLGVPRQAMSVAAVSDNEPIYDESSPAGEAGNRRVEIFFGS